MILPRVSPVVSPRLKSRLPALLVLVWLSSVVFAGESLSEETGGVAAVGGSALPSVPPTLPPDMKKILDRGQLVVAIRNVDVPPFFYHDRSGRLTGLDVNLAYELAHELSQSSGHPVQVVFNRTATTFDELVDVVNRGEADIVISKLSRTLKRAYKIRFTTPYIVLRQGLLINRKLLVELASKEQMHPAVFIQTHLANLNIDGKPIETHEKVDNLFCLGNLGTENQSPVLQSATGMTQYVPITNDREEKNLLLTIEPSDQRAQFGGHAGLVQIVPDEARQTGRLQSPPQTHYKGTIAIVQGSSYVNYALKNFPRAQLVTCPDWNVDIVPSVENGAVLAAYRDELEIKKIIRDRPQSAITLQTVIFRDTLDPIAMAVAWQNEHFLAWVNLFLATKNLNYTPDSLLDTYHH